MSNPYELAGRIKKMHLLCDCAVKAKITAAEMEAASEDDWKLLAEAAKVNVPSAETRRLAIARMKDLETK